MTRYHVTLTKVESLPDGELGPNPPRTTSITGYTTALPGLGRSFRVVGEPLTEGADVRVWETSPITWVTVVRGEISFGTRNSRYEVVRHD